VYRERVIGFNLHLTCTKMLFHIVIPLCSQIHTLHVGGGATDTQFVDSERTNVLLRFCIPSTVVSIYILVFRSVFTLVEKMIKKLCALTLTRSRL
jgi:hypothetical protein